MICGRGYERQPTLVATSLTCVFCWTARKPRTLKTPGPEELRSRCWTGHDKAAVGELRASGQVTGVSDHDRESALWKEDLPVGRYPHLRVESAPGVR